MIKSTGSLRLLVVASFLAASAPAFAKKHVAQPGSPNDDTTTTAAPSGPPPTPDSPTGDKNTPEPPVLADMTAYVLMDAKTGAVLAEAAPNMQLAPASLTKLMTAHIVFQALHDGSLKLDQNVTITPEAWHAGGSRMFLSPNTQVTVDQLLHGLIINSGNDAAVALAEQVAGTQDAFVQIMNKDAATLGLTNTNYTNVDGLPDPALHTSAMDVALLSRAILQDEPEILNISKMQSYTYDNITQQSWNPVLFRDPTVDGLKTGLTDESGHCIDVTGGAQRHAPHRRRHRRPLLACQHGGHRIALGLRPEILHGRANRHRRRADRHRFQPGPGCRKCHRRNPEGHHPDPSDRRDQGNPA